MPLKRKLLSTTVLPWLAALFAAVIAIPALYFVDQTEHRRHQETVNAKTLENLSRLRASLEGHLNTELRLFEGLAAQIALNPEIEGPTIIRIIQQLMQRHQLVHNVGVSEQFILRHIYPLEGNRQALGLNYLEHEQQREPVLRAVSTRQPVLAGPVILVQGGQGLIGRIPVFTAEAHNDKAAGQFWGVVSIVLDLDKLYQLAGLNGEDGTDQLHVAIQGRDGLGQFGDVFYGDPELFERQPVILDMTLPGGRWRIAAEPKAALLQSIPNSTSMVHILGGITVSLFTLAAFFLCRYIQHQQTIIAVQHQHRREMWHTTTHDILTGLPNRLLLQEELVQFIALAKRRHNKVAVLYLNLDHFKDINDSQGHRVGDLYLQAFARHLSQHLQETETLARLGGDEFAIMAMDVNSIDEAAVIADRFTQLADHKVLVEGLELTTGASIGIALAPDDGDTPDRLMRHANLAMSNAKKSPQSTYAFFEPAMNEEVKARTQLIDDIRKGLDNREFKVVYQPIVDIQQSRVVGVEALARWQHPQQGAVSPGVFIPAAESSGLILPFGRWAALQAARDATHELNGGDQPVSVSVNLSAVQLHRGDPLTLVDELLADTGMAPHLLDIEITESAILEDVSKATRIVKALRIRGVSVTIDDFGTGYSSLSHLQRLPVTRIKIDTSFVHKIGSNPQSEAIIKAILFLSQTLKLRVTAEGVETEEQLAFLKTHGCKEIQGFYFSRPQGVEQTRQFIREFSLTNVIAN